MGNRARVQQKVYVSFLTTRYLHKDHVDFRAQVVLNMVSRVPIFKNHTRFSQVVHMGLSKMIGNPFVWKYQNSRTNITRFPKIIRFIKWPKVSLEQTLLCYTSGYSPTTGFPSS